MEADAKQREVWASLAPVTDPELDESVTELGFVTSVEVDGPDVHIQFHLPTYWCAANFAFLMASDMRRSVETLPWVKAVTVELQEHMYAETINRGIAAGHSFQDTFAEEASGELDDVRATFRRKAFQARQELLLRYLLERGYSKHALIEMRMADLAALRPEDNDGRRLLERYRDIRQEWGGEPAAHRRAFVTFDGQVLELGQFSDYLAELRRIRINTQFNGEMCRGLLQARYGNGGREQSAVLVDFPKLANKSIN